MTDTFRLGGDLEVRRPGFGAMRIVDGAAEQAYTVLRRAVELGVDLIDTADAYGRGLPEQRIAEALHPYPDGLVTHTRVGLVNDGSHPWLRERAAGVPARRGRVEPALGGEGRSPRVSLRRLLERSPVMLSIPGTSSLEHLEENMGAAAA